MLKFQELTWPQLEALDRSRTVVFVALSPLEEHGPHLPLGTDLYTGSAIAETIARRLEQRSPQVTAVLLPTIPLGSGAIPYEGTLGVPARLVRETLFRVGKALARDGFRFVVAVSGHLGLSHLAAMEAASRAISRRYGISMVAPVTGLWRGLLRDEQLAARFAALDEPIVGEALRLLLRSHHGGALETSLMLYLHPELVGAGYRQLKRIEWWQLARWRGWAREHWPGYMGDPALARAEVGQVMVEMIAQSGAELTAQLVEGKAGTLKGGAITSQLLTRPTLVLPLVLSLAGVVCGLVGLRFWMGRRAEKR